MLDEMEKVLGNLLKENQPQDYIRIIEEENDKLYEQIDQLTNNWNELEEWLKDLFEKGYDIKLVLDKMKEIKEKNDKD